MQQNGRAEDRSADSGFTLFGTRNCRVMLPAVVLYALLSGAAASASSVNSPEIEAILSERPVGRLIDGRLYEPLPGSPVSIVVGRSAVGIAGWGGCQGDCGGHYDRLHDDPDDPPTEVPLPGSAAAIAAAIFTLLLLKRNSPQRTRP